MSKGEVRGLKTETRATAQVKRAPTTICELNNKLIKFLFNQVFEEAMYNFNLLIIKLLIEINLENNFMMLFIAIFLNLL
jgi:hypothetical protein